MAGRLCRGDVCLKSLSDLIYDRINPGHTVFMEEEEGRRNNVIPVL